MTQKQTLLKMLKKAGNKGLTPPQILRRSFIMNYSNRLSDLNKDGYNIVSVRVPKKNYHRYTLQ